MKSYEPPADDQTHDEVIPVDASQEEATNEYRISDLLKEAARLFERSRATEKRLLDERVALGRVLIQLKGEVGHGNFIKSFEEWHARGLVNFSLKTAQRAMAYAGLESGGKFSDGKNDIVSNLADAERIRMAEEAQRRSTQLPPDVRGGANVAPPPTKLSLAKIGSRARQLADPLIKEFRSYEADTRLRLLEEVIELLTNEHGKCS